jgi:ABC-type sugar transport system ATPase subunit
VLAALQVRALDAGYGERTVVHGATFAVEPGRTLSIVGPSGAGKSTLLRALCGLAPIRAGEIHVGERSIARLAPQQRRVAMVFAHDALARHLTIRANLALAARAPSRIETLAEAFGIAQHLGKRPAELSTGERQRASIARALLCEPDVLLLDEPLAALDPQLRALIRAELVHVREHFAGPMLFVTHDHADAMAVGDELAVLIDGRIADCGEPQRVFDAPASAAVATFVGTRPMNLLPGEIAGEGAGVLVGVRPESMRLVVEGPLRGTVARIERTGVDAYVHVALAEPASAVLVRVGAAAVPALGAPVAIAYDQALLRRFDRASGEAMR